MNRSEKSFLSLRGPITVSHPPLPPLRPPPPPLPPLSATFTQFKVYLIDKVEPLLEEHLYALLGLFNQMKVFFCDSALAA